MSLELTDFRSSTAGSGTSWSFTGCDFGAAADDRYIIIVAGGRLMGAGNRRITNITVGGASTSDVISPSTGFGFAAGIRITSAALTAGTSGTVAVTFDADMGSAWIAVYRATELTSLTPVDTASAAGSGLDASLPLDVLPGFALGGMTIQVASGNVRRGSAASRSFTSAASAHAISAAGSGAQIDWSGLDKDGDANISEGSQTQDFYTAVAASFEIVTASDGAAAGSSTALATGRSEARGQGDAAAGATAAASGRSEARGGGEAQGEALATGAGRSEARASGEAAGSATALAVANVPAGFAAGSATALATGRAEARGQGTAIAGAAVHGRAAMRGRADGAATALAAGRSIARAKGEAAGASSALATPPPAGQAAGSATAMATGRSEARAAGMAEAGAIATAKGRNVRRFFVTADEAGAFALDHAGLLPPGPYAARARASQGGVTTGWSRRVTFEVSE